MKLKQQIVIKKNTMNYKEFIYKSTREDSELNNQIHWFSSLIKNPISYCFYKLKFTPNNVSFLFGIVGILSVYMLIYNQVFLFFILWRLHIVLDMIDGDLARVLNKKSDFGQYIDKLNHGTINPILIFVICDILNNNIHLSLFCAFSFIFFQNTKQYSNKKQILNLTYNKNIFLIILKDLLIIEGLIILVIINQFFHINSTIIPIFYSLIYLIVGLKNLKNEYEKNKNS